MFLHSLEELDNDLGAWSNQDLALPSFFGVVNALQSIVKYRCLDHVGGGDRTSFGWTVRFSSRVVHGLEVSTHERWLAFSSLEHKECPLKGSSARVATRRTYLPLLPHNGLMIR